MVFEFTKKSDFNYIFNFIYNKKIFTMAKAKGGSSTSMKISFGKKALGKAKKAFNKNDRKEKNYRGQGR